jgi:hypothetical protein
LHDDLWTLECFLNRLAHPGHFRMFTDMPPAFIAEADRPAFEVGEEIHLES